MDVRICLLLAAEAGLALVLLWSAGVLRKPAHLSLIHISEPTRRS